MTENHEDTKEARRQYEQSAKNQHTFNNISKHLGPMNLPNNRPLIKRS